MNFDTSRLLPPMGGNNLNTRVSSVRSMNGTQPSHLQLAELLHHFRLHEMTLRTSIAGLLTREGTLSDGSRFRFVSNSGLHQILIWPVLLVRGLLLEDLLLRIFCVPAETANPYGWIKPTVEGQNGTPSTGPNDGETTTAGAGAMFRLKRDPDTQLLSGVKLGRYKPTLFPDVRNAALFANNSANNTSAQSWEHREWTSTDLKKVVTTTDLVRVNGVSHSQPTAVTLWACIYQFDPGTGPVPYLFAVGMETANSLRLYRKPLNSGAWAAVGAALSLATLDAAATSAASRISWIKKVACNASQSVVSVWIQNPSAETLGATGSTAFFVGLADFNMATGALIATTAAQAEVRRRVITASSDVITTSGTRQIAFHYEGDTKVFTGLLFSGSRTVTLTSRTDAATSYTYNWTYTDDREVFLVRGTYSKRISWVEVIAGSHAESGSFAETSPGSGIGLGVADYTHTIEAHFHMATLLYYGGKGEVFALFEREVHRRESWISGGQHQTLLPGNPAATMTRPPPTTWVHQVDTSTDSTQYVRNTHLVEVGESLVTGGDTITAGENIRAAVASTATDTGFIPNWVSSAFIASDSNPTLAQRWGSAGVQDTLSMPSDAGSQPWVNNSTLVLASSGHPSYAVPDAIDNNPFNGRAIDTFLLLSVPKLATLTPTETTTATFTPSAFENYCTDPAMLAKFNVHATQGVLKGICLK